MYSFSVCLWIKSNASPGVGTPFSYAVPGQSNELVLIEWGNNPMEILINDKVGISRALKCNKTKTSARYTEDMQEICLKTQF